MFCGSLLRNAVPRISRSRIVEATVKMCDTEGSRLGTHAII